MLEHGLADLFREQAARFLHGFSAEHLQIALLQGRVELHDLTLRPPELDAMLLESDLPFVVEAGFISSVTVQISVLRGELDLIISGLSLVLRPICRRLSKQEALTHRSSELSRLDFIHSRSANQRRVMECDMFRQIFKDYMSRIKVTLVDLHVRVEIQGELFEDRDSLVVYGLLLRQGRLSPQSTTSAVDQAQQMPPVLVDSKRQASTADVSSETLNPSDLVLSERLDCDGLMLYHEPVSQAKALVEAALAGGTGQHKATPPLKILLRQLAQQKEFHFKASPAAQFMPPINVVAGLDLRGKAMPDGSRRDINLSLDGVIRALTRVRFNTSADIWHHCSWLLRRIAMLQLWSFLHVEATERQAKGWEVVRLFMNVRRRLQLNRFPLSEAIALRKHCKEYVRLHKKRSNGPQSSHAWRKSLPSLTPEEEARLLALELKYPGDKLVNFRMMALAEVRTEAALNCIPAYTGGGQAAACADFDGVMPRELTPLEQLHLHGLNGYGASIYKGLSIPPSSTKACIDIQLAGGLFVVCEMGHSSCASSTSPLLDDPSRPWALALDCSMQPVRLALLDTIVDSSVSGVFEIFPLPDGYPGRLRPCSLLLGRTANAFCAGSPRHPRGLDENCGGSDSAEWCSLLEVDGPLQCLARAKMVLTASSTTPWDIFTHLTVGDDGGGGNGGGGLRRHLGRRLSAQDLGLRGPAPWMAAAPPTASSSGSSIGSSHKSTWTPTNAAAATRSRDYGAQCLRFHAPFRLPSGQNGPLLDLLSWLQEVDTAAAWTRFVVSAFPGRCKSPDAAVTSLRLRARLPPLRFSHTKAYAGILLPCTDLGVHVDYTGLADGFVMGLHRLPHFLGADGPIFGEPKPQPREDKREKPSPSLASSWTIKFPQVPLCWVLALVMALSSAAAGDEDSILLLRDSGLMHCLAASSQGEGAHRVSLWLLVLAAIFTRRELWDAREDQPELEVDVMGMNPERRSNQGHGAERLCGSGGGGSQGMEALGRMMEPLHSIFARALGALMSFGFPLHPCCGQLAAWMGAPEIMACVAENRGGMGLDSTWLLAVARGSLAARRSRTMEAIRWLVDARADLSVRDRKSRNLMHWAAWSGDEELIRYALRAGLSPNNPPKPGTIHSPLSLALLSRSLQAVQALLRASADLHALSNCSSEQSKETSGARHSSQWTGCNVCHQSRTSCTCNRSSTTTPLLLAVKCCEFRLASELLRSSLQPDVSFALAAPSVIAFSSNSAVAATDSEEAMSYRSSSLEARATTVTLEALCRFAGVLARKSNHTLEDCTTVNLSRAGMSGANVDAHPDDGLFEVGKLPFSDVVHPLVVEMPIPVHRVARRDRPGFAPCSWLSECREDPWMVIKRFLRCCSHVGFRWDKSVVHRTWQSLPAALRACLEELPDIAGSLPPEPPSPLECREESESSNASCRQQQQHHQQQLQNPRPLTCLEGEASSSERLELSESTRSAKAEVRRFMEGGAWQRPSNKSCMHRRTAEAVDASLPCVRILVSGWPQSGKTTVANRIGSSLMRVLEDAPEVWDIDAETPATFRVTGGVWPKVGVPAARMMLMDTQAATLPGVWHSVRQDADSGTTTTIIVNIQDGEAEAKGRDHHSDDIAGIESVQLFQVENVQKAAADKEEGGFWVASPSSQGEGRDEAEEEPIIRDQDGWTSLRCSVVGQEGARAMTQAINKLVEAAVLATERIRTQSQRLFAAPSIPGTLSGDFAESSDFAQAMWAWAAIHTSREVLTLQRALPALVPACFLRRRLLHNDGNSLQALSSLSLVCPVAKTGKNAALEGDTNDGCYCLVPDFADKAHVAAELAAVWGLPPSQHQLRHSGGPGQNDRAHSEEGTPPPCYPNLSGSTGSTWSSTASTMASEGAAAGKHLKVSARLCWNDSSEGPSMRRLLRDLLSLGLGFGGVDELLLQVHDFVLLEQGPPSEDLTVLELDDLGPGFFLAFTLPGGKAAGTEVVKTSDKDPFTKRGGVKTDESWTLLIVGRGRTRRRSQPGDEGSSEVNSYPLWEVFAAGPHARLALRSVLRHSSMGRTNFAALLSKAEAKPTARCSAGSVGSPTASAASAAKSRTSSTSSNPCSPASLPPGGPVGGAGGVAASSGSWAMPPPQGHFFVEPPDDSALCPQVSPGVCAEACWLMHAKHHSTELDRSSLLQLPKLSDITGWTPSQARRTADEQRGGLSVAALCASLCRRRGGSKQQKKQQKQLQQAHLKGRQDERGNFTSSGQMSSLKEQPSHDQQLDSDSECYDSEVLSDELEGIPEASASVRAEVALTLRDWKLLPGFLLEVLHAGEEEVALTSLALAQLADQLLAESTKIGATKRPLLPWVGIEESNPTRGDRVGASLPNLPLSILLHRRPFASGKLPVAKAPDLEQRDVPATRGIRLWSAVCRPFLLWSAGVQSLRQQTSSCGSGSGSGSTGKVVKGGCSMAVKAGERHKAASICNEVALALKAALDHAATHLAFNELCELEQLLMQQPHSHCQSADRSMPSWTCSPAPPSSTQQARPSAISTGGNQALQEIDTAEGGVMVI